jgi:serine/threonine-protein kinase
MAELYLCSARGPGGFEKEVVIKRIRPHLASDPEFVRMFMAEARLVSRLNHPNIVQIFDFDKHQDTYYLAMEYVRGRSLAELRKRCKSRLIAVPVMLAAHIAAEVARGLHHAHRPSENGGSIGLVHRDVTPQNVLLSFDGAVKLTDFGIAKASDKLTAPGRLKGKLAYMSPEQSRGESVDARTDVFALGIVLWEMLTGGRLFDGENDMAVLEAVRTSAIPRVARVNPDVPSDLDDAVMKALARDPQCRHQSAQELERALANCVLRHARALEDTDVAGFLRAVFGDEFPLPAAEGSALPAESVNLWTGSCTRPASPSQKLQEPDCGPDRAAEKTEGLKAGSSSGRSTQLGSLKPGRGVGGNQKGRGAMWRVSASAAILIASAALPLSQLWRKGHAGPSAQPAPRDLPAPTPGSHAGEAEPAEVAPPQSTAAIFSRGSGADLSPTEHSQTREGTLVVKIAPWAFLSIDGRSKGEVSGVRRYRLSAGKHQLRLWHPRASKEWEILLREGERRVEEYRILSPAQ